MVEYGDFQWPACANYFPLIKQVEEKYADKVSFQFRHFPLIQIHPNAMAASRAAEAAGNQGKFFEMHDMLYENQDSNPTSVFENYASQLGLDMSKYQTDVGSQETNAVINADLKAGQAAGVNSTPTFYLDGKKIESNPQTADEFYKLIDEALAAKNRQ